LQAIPGPQLAVHANLLSCNEFQPIQDQYPEAFEHLLKQACAEYPPAPRKFVDANQRLKLSQLFNLVDLDQNTFVTEEEFKQNRAPIQQCIKELGWETVWFDQQFSAIATGIKNEYCTCVTKEQFIGIMIKYFCPS